VSNSNNDKLAVEDSKTPRVRLIEFSFHNGVVANLILAMSAGAQVDVYIRWRTKSNWRDELGLSSREFVGHVADATQSRAIASLSFYKDLLRGLRGSDVLWISTGPESKILADLLFFALLILLKGRKIVLSIRNVARWTRPGSRFFSQDSLRYWLLQRVSRVVFESETQRQCFRLDVPQFQGRTAVLPVFFSDAETIWQNSVDTLVASESFERAGLKIGLLGGIDPSKRDYGVLAAALRQLGSNAQQTVTLSVLGAAKTAQAEVVLHSLSRSVLVEKFGEYISNRTMVAEMKRCDVLIAPLRDDLGYGEQKGTGSVGDALLAGCKLLIPSAIPVDQEFRPATIPYASAEELAQIILSLIDTREANEIPTKILNNYSVKVAFNRALRDLNLTDFSP
jgi:hypothetical protein